MRVTDTHYFFWKHEFGQWTRRSMTDFDGTNYNCCEQYMMVQKARLFGDDEMVDLILEETRPNKQQDLGRKVKNFDPQIWDNWKFSIVLSGNLLKFTQHPDLKKRLLSTSEKVLVEASPYDRIWGVGLSSSDDRILDEANWEGENLLGEVLMAVREIFNKENDKSITKRYQRIKTPLQVDEEEDSECMVDE